VMKQAVAHLVPFIEAEKSEGAKPKGKIILATAKGDVHDIGKNIVGVVLQCNNYAVIDLGVMVPCAKILQTAVDENADVVGVSGLITPSLEEMVHVAKEMEREGFDIPLLIGGATTSRVHTAVKIEPGYQGPTIYVPDASRSVGVMSNLMSEELKPAYVKSVKAEYEKVRAQHKAKKGQGPRHTIAEARKHGLQTDWATYAPPRPTFIGLNVLRDYSLLEISRSIDWTPFFQTWELRGRYPAILQDDVVGKTARNLFNDAQAMLAKIIAEKWLTANGVAALFPANTVNGDDIEIYRDESRTEVGMVLHNLRQPMVKPADRHNWCLADFIAPKETGVRDYIGAFAVTAGIGIDKLVKEFEAKHDDYNAIMLKALADRLAEAFAEALHMRVRREFWGY
ncbi:MAG: vitamin B12 dependent-methionine synthase activation domain-containing protein, partial [Burkholderiales bacterium]